MLCLPFCLPKLVITWRTIAFTQQLSRMHERLEWLSNNKPTTWLAEGHVISNKLFITHLDNLSCLGWCNNGLGYIMHPPAALSRPLLHHPRRKLKHLWLVKCVINNTYILWPFILPMTALGENMEILHVSYVSLTTRPHPLLIVVSQQSRFLKKPMILPLWHGAISVQKLILLTQHNQESTHQTPSSSKDRAWDYKLQ